MVIDDINIEKLPSFIKFGIGHVEQISMNRRGLYSNPVKTLFFWGSLDKFENSESLAEELKECKTI